MDTLSRRMFYLVMISALLASFFTMGCGDDDDDDDSDVSPCDDDTGDDDDADDDDDDITACATSDDCADTQYCSKEPGDCVSDGACVELPLACPDLWAPVCGCDGMTYANDCEAAMTGTSVDHEGDCFIEPDTCATSDECLAGQYCIKEAGDCEGDGYCIEMPEACFDVWDPVCGCDGITYANTCYAAMAGVNVDYDGECAPPDCADNSECTPDVQYCSKAPGDCEGDGVCAERPEACPDIWLPVCGCDGITYANDCDAAMAGVNVDYDGECLPPECTDNDDCAADVQYCAKETGDCEGDGSCDERPVACPDVWDPVCGCDGLTYSNVCFAAMAGVSVDYEGECYIEPPTCTINGECAADVEYCAKAPEDCEGDGACAERPLSCPAIWDPVCGCDEITHSNACFAAMAGTNVDYEGDCYTEPPVCTDNAECTPVLEYCSKADGDCDGDGSCQDRPLGCPDVWDPICGCNGTTHSNACDAAMLGINVDYEGRCIPPDPPVLQWAFRFGDAEMNQKVLDLTTDIDGNVILLGYYDSTLDIGTGMISQGLSDIFIAKFQPDGTLTWIKSYGDASAQHAWAVTTDATGNIYALGTFAGTVNFSEDPGDAMIGAGGMDIYMVKLASNGDHIWSQSFGDSDWQYGYDIAVDTAGNVVITGEFRGSVDFGGGVLDSAGGSDIYLAKFDTDGVHQWSDRFGSASNPQSGDAVAVDGAGNVYFGGSYEGDVDFGGGWIGNSGLSDIFIAKFTSAGAYVWARRYGDADDEFFGDIHIGPGGEIYATGSFKNEIDLGCGVLTSAGDLDIFLSQLDTDVACQWSDRYGNSSIQYSQGLDTDAAGNVYMTGAFFGTVNFGLEDHTSANMRDLYIAKFDSTGTGIWSGGFGGDSDQESFAVAVHSPTEIYIGGYLFSMFNFGGDTPWLVSDGQDDAFLAKLSN